MLMDEGFNVELACDGLRGIKAFKKIKPKITFLDIKMPGMDGYETFQKIKKIDPNAKVAFITGFMTDNEKHKSAEENNLVDTIKKPVDLRDLLKVIKKYS